MDFSFVEVAIAFAVLYVMYKLFVKNKTVSKAPPSLPSLPIVGSLPFLSGLDQLHVCFAEKAKRYGNIFSFNAAGRYTLVLNGYDALQGALMRRALDFAGRSVFYSEQKIINPQQRGIAMKQYGETLKNNKLITITILKQFGYEDRGIMENKIQSEVGYLKTYFMSLKGQATYPNKILDVSALNVINNLIFSQRFDFDDKTGEVLTAYIREFMDSYDPVLDLFPVFRHLPRYQQQFKHLVATVEELFTFLKEKIKECMSSASTDDNFVREYMKKVGNQYDEPELLMILRDILSAGSETNATQLNWALVLLCNNVEVQKRLQKDIDSVVDKDRMPSLADKDKLSYVEAFILELMRVRTIVPLGAPHTTLCETEVNGYIVPADTMVLINLWSAHMDPQVWPEPEKFRPERFLDEHDNIIKRDLMIAFSLGKRSCLGKVLALQVLFLYITALLQEFDILPPEGETSVPDRMVLKRLMTPAPYEVRFVPRTTNFVGTPNV
jgi:cytochrome P450